MESSEERVITYARFTLFTTRDLLQDEDDIDDEEKLVDALIASRRAMGAALPQRCA